ncbi:MAG TPA: NAD(P)/FAD-dependent oxidoreductase [bacterium]|nr:NAD(P)/FAD-dependent oxidoreductase [bacterium]
MKDKGSKKILVVGGGAAGLMAAVRAAELGADVTVLEKMNRPGRKILITGNGRCNVTTASGAAEAVAAFGANGRFLHGAFSKFFAPDLLSMFENLGVPMKLESGKRYFPSSDKASDIADALTEQVKSRGGKILTGMKVTGVETGGGRVSGVIIAGKESALSPNDNSCDSGDGAALSNIMHAERVILATGGMSYPATGATGDGYLIAGVLGHTVVEPRAALVPIELKGLVHKQLSPLPLKDILVKLVFRGKTVAESFGEMMFTPFGVTGPAVLNLGKHVSGVESVKDLSLLIDIKPDLDSRNVDEILLRELNAAGGKTAKSALEKILPKRAAPVFLSLAGIEPEKKAGVITKAERAKLARLIKGVSFQVKGARPIEEAIITAGGVSVNEINPKTMESKIIKSLYICGELLDVDGPTGGFNLQAAFSTGWLAGTAAAESL